MPRRRTAQIITIYWRDIPSQVNGMAGAEKHQILLKPRFEKAIDRAAMRAGITTASDYVEEWRREATPCNEDVTQAAKDLAEKLEQEFTLERLNELVANGGFDPDREDPAPEDPAPEDPAPEDPAPQDPAHSPGEPT